jgi:hypothetical protein
MAVGEKNAYWCDSCHGYVVTIDVDDGVTPMFLACRAKGEPTDPGNDCRGTSRSMMYPDEPWPDQDGYGNAIPTEPEWEWYRPTLKWARRQGAETLDHVNRGGLLLRRCQ